MVDKKIGTLPSHHTQILETTVKIAPASYNKILLRTIGNHLRDGSVSVQVQVVEQRILNPVFLWLGFGIKKTKTRNCLPNAIYIFFFLRIIVLFQRFKCLFTFLKNILNRFVQTREHVSSFCCYVPKLFLCEPVFPAVVLWVKDKWMDRATLFVFANYYVSVWCGG